jgi:hypothetical protein
MYKLIKDSLTNEVCSVLKGNNMSIPFDPANTDYQDYLAWCAEGNVPEPADQPTE